MLTGDERAYLFHLAGEAAPASGGPTREVRVALRSLLATMNDIPAYVMDAKYDVLAWNHLATFFIGDLEQVPAEDRNVLRWMFTAPRDDTYWDDKDALAFARSSVADLRAAAARYPGDRGIHDLVTEMLGTSPRFAALWAEHEVAVRRSVRKTISHPAVGPIEIDCQVLHIPDTDQRLVVYVAAPGSPGTEALRTLRELAPPRPQSSVRG
jgi:hypothetical protein